MTAAATSAYLNQPCRSEIQALQDRKDELYRLMEIEQRAVGRSDAWMTMAEEYDRVDDLLIVLKAEKEAEEADAIDRIRSSYMNGKSGWRPWDADQ